MKALFLGQGVTQQNCFLYPQASCLGSAFAADGALAADATSGAACSADPSAGDRWVPDDAGIVLQLLCRVPGVLQQWQRGLCDVEVCVCSFVWLQVSLAPF